MLTRLIIENYALIERLDVVFPDGLIIITGETGAGKSILLGALSLILGSRADETVLKNKSANCVVEAEFKIESSELSEWLRGEGYELQDDTVILRRLVSPSGRSRSFLNDEPVSVKTLSAISTQLIDIHAQHQHLLLSDMGFQRNLLDSYAGLGTPLDEYRRSYGKYEEIVRKLANLEKTISESSAEYEYKTYRYNLLKNAGLRSGEMEELEKEHKVLSNAEDIKDMMNSVLDSFCPSGESLSQLLKNAASVLYKLSSYDACFSSLAERISTDRIDLDDVLSELNDRNERMEVSPERLQQVEERISLLVSLMRKFSVSDVESLIGLERQMEEELAAVADYDDIRESLLSELRSLKIRMEEQADILYRCRVEAAVKLSDRIAAVVRNLEMPDAKISYVLEKRQEYDIYGADSLRVMFSANAGHEMRDISGTASGGEMSRVALALKSVMAEYVGMPVMIFDEIDTGVSGKAADKMGALIAELSSKMQIIAITHLPQIASKGDAHFVVYKSCDETGSAVSRIRRVSGEERVKEIASMLSGSVLGNAALANARELMGI